MVHVVHHLCDCHQCCCQNGCEAQPHRHIKGPCLMIMLMDVGNCPKAELPREKFCYRWLHRRLLRRYRPQSAVNCSTLWEQTTGSQPSTSQVSLGVICELFKTILRIKKKSCSNSTSHTSVDSYKLQFLLSRFRGSLSRQVSESCGPRCVFLKLKMKFLVLLIICSKWMIPLTAPSPDLRYKNRLQKISRSIQLLPELPRLSSALNGGDGWGWGRLGDAKPQNKRPNKNQKNKKNKKTKKPKKPQKNQKTQKTQKTQKYRSLWFREF